MASTETQSLVEKLLAAYKQAAQYYLAFIGYAIIAGIVIGIGFAMGGFAALTPGGDGGIVGLIVVFIGIVLFITAGFSAIIFAASRGGLISEPIAFFEAYKVTFKLILELGAALLVAVIFFILGSVIGGGLGTVFNVIGGLAFLLFPAAGLFYVINYIVSRK